MHIHSLRDRQLWCAAAVLLLIGASACAVDRISAPGPLAEGRSVVLAGKSTLLLATPSGVERHPLGAWSSSATVERSFARVASARPSGLHLNVANGATESGAVAKRRGSTLLRVLAIRDDARRAQPGEIFARRWMQDGAELVTGIRIGNSGLPETIVLFRNDVPVTLLRYSYVREPGGWRASSAVSIAFDEGKATLALVEEVDAPGVANAGFGQEALSAAASTVAGMRQSVVWKRMADALVPPLHAYEDGCWRELADYATASATVVVAAAAVAIACGSMTPACLAAIAAYLKAVEMWAAALDRLYKCNGYKIGHEGGGGSTTNFVIWNVPDRGSIESKMNTVCEHNCFDHAY